MPQRSKFFMNTFHPFPADFESPKGKDQKTWKGRMVRKFKRYGSSSSAPIEHSSEIEPEVTGTFGVHIELCPASPDNDVSVLLWIEHSSMIIFSFF